MLDSLMQSMDEEETNQMAIRAGYNSNINGYGNTAVLNEFGISAGVAFYHRSGLFADVAGYYSDQYAPSYYQTMASVGYINSDLKKLSFMAEYRKSFYHFDTESFLITPEMLLRYPRLANFYNNYATGIYSNALSATSYFEHKLLNLRLDYTILFQKGMDPAHRLVPTAALQLEKRKWLKLERASIVPSISWLYGGDPVTEIKRLYETRIEALYRIRNGLPLFKLITRTQWQTLNWSLSLPIFVSWKRTGLSLSYTHGWPVGGGYFICSATRYISFKNKAKKSGQ